MNYIPRNRLYRTILLACASGVAVVALAGGGPRLEADDAPRAADSSSTGTALLAQAADSLATHRSITARMRFRGQVFGEPLMGTGDYWQGPAASGVWRLELKLQIAGETHSLQQVCDGNALWTHRDRGRSSEVQRVDLARLKASSAGSAAAGSAPPLAGLPAGGLPALLESLHACFALHPVAPRNLYGLPMQVLEGTWKTDVLARLRPELRTGDSVRWNRLPAHLPQQVRVYLGPDDHFPYRVEYLRTSTLAGRTMASGAPLELVVELYEVQFNTRLERSRFEFQPGSATVSDVTEQWIRRRANW